jgi:hypothetical protein
MIRSSLKLLGLCAVVLGVMAFGAGAAQAEVGAKWLVLTAGGETKDAANLKALVEGKIENNLASLLSEVLGIEVEILCTSGTLTGVSLEGEGKITNGGKVTFKGCSVDLNGEASSACQPHSVGSPTGTVETNAGKGLLSLVLSGVAGTVIVAKEGTTLANVNMGSECPIGENIPVRGSLVIEDAALTTHSAVHLIKENAVHSHLWVLNDTAEHSAKIDGSAEVSLAGEHVGLKWSGDPA